MINDEPFEYDIYILKNQNLAGCTGVCALIAQPESECRKPWSWKNALNVLITPCYSVVAGVAPYFSADMK